MDQHQKPDLMAHLNTLGMANKFAIEQGSRFSAKPLTESEPNKSANKQLLPNSFDIDDLRRIKATLDSAKLTPQTSDNREFLVKLADSLLKKCGILDDTQYLNESSLDSVSEQINDLVSS